MTRILPSDPQASPDLSERSRLYFNGTLELRQLHENSRNGIKRPVPQIPGDVCNGL